MLVLSRKVNEEIVIGEMIRIKVLKVNGSRIQIGIIAPDDMRIERAELWSEYAVDPRSEELLQTAS